MRMHLVPIAALACLAQPVPAVVTVVQCADAEGETLFAETCPPGTTVVAEKRLPGAPKEQAPDLAELAERSPVTLYAVADCDACDLVRNQLERRGIPFTEKDAGDDVEVQKELQALSGGLTVPAVRIAERVLTGYDKRALDSALDEAGYPDASSAAAKTPGPAP